MQFVDRLDESIFIEGEVTRVDISVASIYGNDSVSGQLGSESDEPRAEFGDDISEEVLHWFLGWFWLW